jgi:hypothetical protein
MSFLLRYSLLQAGYIRGPALELPQLPARGLPDLLIMYH